MRSMITNSVNDEIRIRSLKDAVRILYTLVRYFISKLDSEPNNYIKEQLRDVDSFLRAVENAETKSSTEAGKVGIG